MCYTSNFIPYNQILIFMEGDKKSEVAKLKVSENFSPITVEDRSKFRNYIRHFVTETIGDKAKDPGKVFDEKIKDKVIFLDNPPKSSEKAKWKQIEKMKHARFGRVMTAKEKRISQIYHVPKEACKFELYEPLHELWKGYMNELWGHKNTNYQALTPKLLKADLHGALITVRKSTCASFLGKSGICIQETANMLKLVTRDNKCINIPKGYNIFTFEVRGILFYIHGNQIRQRGAVRANKKYKTKPTIDL
ncbi:hypothetical protein G9A89_004700 [Geosiphon pyriformis]|nr:hypothetical protein G9A89_004700 [Geosiphon pyriformis]